MVRFRTVSSPLVRKQAGSVGIFGGGNTTTGSTYSISVWDTHSALENSNAVPEVVEAMAGYAEWMAGHFVVESFEIVTGVIVGPFPQSDESLWCRVSITSSVPGHSPAALESFSARLDQVRALSTACVGTALLSPLVGSKLVALEYWTDHHDLVASEPRVAAIDQRLHRAGLFQSPTVRDLIEILETS